MNVYSLLSSLGVPSGDPDSRVVRIARLDEGRVALHAKPAPDDPDQSDCAVVVKEPAGSAYEVKLAALIAITEWRDRYQGPARLPRNVEGLSMAALGI